MDCIYILDANKLIRNEHLTYENWKLKEIYNIFCAFIDSPVKVNSNTTFKKWDMYIQEFR